MPATETTEKNSTDHKGVLNQTLRKGLGKGRRIREQKSRYLGKGVTSDLFLPPVAYLCVSFGMCM